MDCTLFRSLLQHVREMNLASGECAEFHVAPGTDPALPADPNRFFQKLTTRDQFASDWAHVFDGYDDRYENIAAFMYGIRSNQHAYAGIVHDDGAILIALESAGVAW